MCSHCSRLRQNCYYDDGSHNMTGRISIERTPVPTPGRAQETHLISSSDVTLVSELYPSK